ncbi:thiamine pyrophosphate-binding protein [Microbispora sp. NEAU-D428]|uniref:thiamine pyrophosphate-binding protein n=1 Tax=Microbispora sitophila TaxID=2771537 RepID=UPI0018662495|nr:thiamine pyrophosphate-binding protein [Microbispora sitophila]MBE3015830.1 thiamine pyrophosphate-binding protein [Microbispora sitophila]
MASIVDGVHAESPLFIDHLMDTLRQLKVDTVFGLPGSAIGPVLDRILRDSEIDLVVARHESGAVAMADGYARATGRLGVALVTAGPGALNALPHLAVAQADNSAVLLISGETAQGVHGRGAFQESTDDGISTVEAFRPCTSYSRALSHPGSAATLLSNAVRHALSLPRGAVHLSIPVDLYNVRIPVPARPRLATVQWAPAPPPTIAEWTLDALLSASHPLILLGNGARDGLTRGTSLAEDLADLSCRHALPIATTTKGKGIFPENRAESLGVASIGGSARARAYLSGSPDVVLVVGSSMGEWATCNWATALQGTHRLIQVDVDPQKIGRSYHVDDAVVCDAGAFLRALIEAEPLQTGRDLAARRRTHLDGLPPLHPRPPEGRDQTTPIKPQTVMHHLRLWLDSETPRLMFLDVGNTTGWFSQQVAISAPHQALMPWGMASMGWANAAVIGAKIARPAATCVALTGDGGFLMNAVEIATAALRRVGAIWVVLQDDCYNMVRQGMQHAYPRSPQAQEEFRLGDCDLSALAESLGARAHPVRHPGDLGAALANAEKLARERQQPQVVCVRVDRDERGPFRDRNDAVSRSFQGNRPASET